MSVIRKWGVTFLLLLGIGGIVFYNIRRRNQYKKDHVFVELKAFQWSKGWGYDILRNGQPYIHQDIVPAVTAHGWGFRTREDALAVGKKAYQQVLAGHMPIITKAQLDSLGIVPADSLHR